MSERLPERTVVNLPAVERTTLDEMLRAVLRRGLQVANRFDLAETVFFDPKFLRQETTLFLETRPGRVQMKTRVDLRPVRIRLDACEPSDVRKRSVHEFPEAEKGVIRVETTFASRDEKIPPIPPRPTSPALPFPAPESHVRRQSPAPDRLSQTEHPRDGFLHFTLSHRTLTTTTTRSRKDIGRAVEIIEWHPLFQFVRVESGHTGGQVFQGPTGAPFGRIRHIPWRCRPACERGCTATGATRRLRDTLNGRQAFVLGELRRLGSLPARATYETIHSRERFEMIAGDIRTTENFNEREPTTLHQLVNALTRDAESNGAKMRTR